MNIRSRIVVGSLGGALAIHLAMVACSGGGSPPREDAGAVDVAANDGDTRDATNDHPLDVDGRDADDRDVAERDAPKDRGLFDVVIDAVKDVMSDVIDAEVPDAVAGGDGGVPPPTRTCDCLPPVPEHSVSFRLVGPDDTTPIAPLPGFTTVSTLVEKEPGNTDFPLGAYVIRSTATFLTRTMPTPAGSYARVTLRCSAAFRVGTLAPFPGTRPQCSMTGQMGFGTRTLSFNDTSGFAPDVELVALTETTAHYRLPRVTFMDTSRATVTFTAIEFRASVPGARFLNPIDQYRPPTP